MVTYTSKEVERLVKKIMIDKNLSEEKALDHYYNNFFKWDINKGKSLKAKRIK